MKILGLALFVLWTVFLGLCWFVQQFMEHAGDALVCGGMNPGCKGTPDPHLWAYSAMWGLGLVLIGRATFWKTRKELRD